MNTLAAVRTSAARLRLLHSLRLGACLIWASASWQAQAAGPEAGALAAPAPITGASYLPHPTLPPGTGARVDFTGWLTPGRPSSLGLSMGLRANGDALPHPYGMQPPAWQPDLGVHWRTRLSGTARLDFAAWARIPQGSPARDAMGLIWQDEPEPFGARIELQWKSSRTRGLAPEYGAIGLQLDNSSRLLLRARHGGPMVYYRAKF